MSQLHVSGNDDERNVVRFAYMQTHVWYARLQIVKIRSSKLSEKRNESCNDHNGL